MDHRWVARNVGQRTFTRGERVCVRRHRHDVRVPRDRPELVVLIPVQRGLLPQVGVHRPWVVDVRVQVEQVVVVFAHGLITLQRRRVASIARRKQPSTAE